MNKMYSALFGHFIYFIAIVLMMYSGPFFQNIAVVGMWFVSIVYLLCALVTCAYIGQTVNIKSVKHSNIINVVDTLSKVALGYIAYGFGYVVLSYTVVASAAALMVVLYILINQNTETKNVN